MLKNSFLLISLLLVSVFNPNLGMARFLPIEIEEELTLESQPNITKQEFDDLIDEIATVYKPIVNEFGGRLKIEGKWRSKRIFAGATRLFGSWKVRVTGGLARHPELTPDGLTLIICHEIGHHLAGYAFAERRHPLEGKWASSEGQSDYYATHVCSRKLWAHQEEKNAEFRQLARHYIQQQCDLVWKSKAEQNLCYRTNVAVESMITTMATLLKKQQMPDFETPDPQIVEKTKRSHPRVQCRMDTSLNGSLCSAAFNDQLIPGRKVRGGIHSQAAEKEAAQTSCMSINGDEFGLRPRCWFKPLLTEN